MKYKFLYIITFVLSGFLLHSQEIKDKFLFKNDAKSEMGYILKLPANQKKKFPLMIFLHGSGERGNDLEKVKSHSPFTYQNEIKEEIAILAPQCPENVWWDTKLVYELIMATISKYNIDTNRIYITGLSMGGWGTWKLAIEHPELFAAVVPVCAPADRFMIINAGKLNMPIRIYHGALDDIVPPSESIDMHQKLKKENKQSELFIFSNDNHNSWDSTYSNPELYKWLLSQQKK